MLKKIRGYFGMEGSEDVSLLDADEHVRLAIATVLLSSALSDSNLSTVERDLLLKQLETRLGISREDALSLEAHAENDNNKQILERYTEALLSLSVAQREQILALAWDIISADTIIADDESRFAAKLRHSLGLSIEQSIRARKLAQDAPEGFKEIVEASREVQEALQQQLRRLHPSHK